MIFVLASNCFVSPFVFCYYCIQALDYLAEAFLILFNNLSGSLEKKSFCAYAQSCWTLFLEEAKGTFDPLELVLHCCCGKDAFHLKISAVQN